MSQAELNMVAAGGVIGGMTTFFFTAIMVFYVLLVIAEWKIFTKAGEAGWKSLIPIYSTYITYKISGISFLKWFVLPIVGGGFIISLITSLVPALQQIGNIAILIISIAVSIKACSALADAFGKGTGFKIGLFFLPNIFTLILGFGTAEYIGPANNDN